VMIEQLEDLLGPDGKSTGSQKRGWCDLVGEISALVAKKPCDPKTDFSDAVGAKQTGDVARFTSSVPLTAIRKGLAIRVELQCDLVADAKGLAVDGNHLPPYLPARKTGDQIEGGLFASWFELQLS